MLHRLSLLWLLPFLILPSLGQAQEGGDGTLHVLRPVIRAERSKAELCLEFDHDLDPGNTANLAANVRLRAGRKTLTLTPSNISIIGRTFCLYALDHRQDYRLNITNLRGAKGEKLDGPYSLSFSIPDQPPGLAFAGGGNGFLRWQGKDPVLRAINVPEVEIEFYRVSDPAAMAQAWRERQQVTLAPSESLYLAQHRGQLLWKGGLVLGDTPNQALEQKIPLRALAGETSPGLYLIMARAVKADDEDEEKTAPPPLTATWLLRSDLQLGALRDPKGFYALTETMKGEAAPDVQLLILNAKGETLSENKSGADSIAFFPFAPDKARNAVMIAGYTTAGDADFVALDSSEARRMALPGNVMDMTSVKPFHAPGTEASVVLVSRDSRGNPLPLDGSNLKLLRPDKSLYASFPVPRDDSGRARLTFPAPASNGTWLLVWQNSGGATLAETPLRVSHSTDAPHFEMTADRPLLTPHGDVQLTIRSLTHDDKPATFIPGRLFVTWATTDQIFPGWKGYRFGTGISSSNDPVSVASFVTDDRGFVVLRPRLVPPDSLPGARRAILTLRSGAATGAAPPPLTLPVSPQDFAIGIKPLAADARFSENGSARFSLIALDTEGHRRAVEGLVYQIYEEGRSFEWYQDEGRWNYKPQQHKRRIGGGTLTLGEEGEDIIDWPVTAGSYRIEIARTGGTLLTAMNFSAGWTEADNNAPARGSLGITASPDKLKPGQTTSLRFKLDHPAMVSAFIGDDHIRRVIHQPMETGVREISFTPEKDWGNRIAVRVETRDQAGALTLPMTMDGKAEEKTIAETKEALAVTADFPLVLRKGDFIQLPVNLKNNRAPAGTYRYTLSAGPGTRLASGTSTSLKPGSAQTLVFPFTATQTGSVRLKFDVMGPGRTHIEKEWVISIVDENTSLKIATEASLKPKESWPPATGKKTTAPSKGGFVFVGARPVTGLPALLSSAMDMPAVTTDQIAAALETLRLWRDVIVASDMLPDSAVDGRREELLLRLLARQKSDGGFPTLPGEQADMAATAAAVTALAQASSPLTKTGFEHATGWLRHRLDNNWFEESERSLRAAAYAALAVANQLDVSSLHYFADTGADKSLPPLAALQLAAAFAHINDQAKSSFWLNAAAVKDRTDIPAAELALLAENRFSDPQTVVPALEKLSGTMKKNPMRDPESLAALLRAQHAVQGRAGNWQVTVGTDKRDPKKILVVALPDKAAPPTIHNSGDVPLFLTEAQRTTDATTTSISRHIYRMNNAEVAPGMPLSQGETYLVTLEGSWPEGSAPFHLHDAPGAGLRPAGCLPGSSPETTEALAWLKTLPLTPVTLCETGDGSVDMLMTRKEGADTWYAAYLARAEQKGDFDGPGIFLKSAKGDPVRSAASRVTIR